MQMSVYKCRAYDHLIQTNIVDSKTPVKISFEKLEHFLSQIKGGGEINF